MVRSNLKTLILMSIFMIVSIVKGEYIEGIDTTDENGITKDGLINLQDPFLSKANLIARYCDYRLDCSGYFNYTFEEVMIAPLKSTLGLCDYEKEFVYVFMDKRDSTYSKYVKIGKLSDGRYIYRYGKNTTPHDRLLVKSDYDKSKKYNVNNFYFNFYSCREVNLGVQIICNEEIPPISFYPPLPNNNKLIGYILYYTSNIRKEDSYINPFTIDSSMLNYLEWDSVMFIKEFNPYELTERKIVIWDSLSQRYKKTHMLGEWFFFNIVALYEEGKSDFLKGWTLCTPSRVGNIFKIEMKRKKIFDIDIIKCGKEIILHLSKNELDINTQTKVELFSILGERVSKGKLIKDNFILRLSNDQVRNGVYIVRITTEGGRVYSQPANLNVLRRF